MKESTRCETHLQTATNKARDFVFVWVQLSKFIPLESYFKNMWCANVTESWWRKLSIPCTALSNVLPSFWGLYQSLFCHYIV